MKNLLTAILAIMLIGTVATAQDVKIEQADSGTSQSMKSNKVAEADSKHPKHPEGKNRKGKAGYKSDSAFSGPGSTGYQLEEDDAEKTPHMRLAAIDDALSPWFSWKGRVKEKIGLQLGVAYTTLYQNVYNESKSSLEDDGFSTILRISGKWTLLNRNTKNSGSLVFSADHRHAYTDTAPGDLGFATGYYGIPGTLFSDTGVVLGDLNWQQYLNDGKTGIVIGRYDPNDFFDVLGYANPWTTFQNAAILFNTSIALPDWSTGMGVGHWINDQWYVAASVSDANGVVTETHFFKDYDELYTTAEISWSPSRSERYLKNLHITGWHVDEREEAGAEESEGVTFGANWTFNEIWMPFIKAGISDGSAPLYNESVTAGMIYYFPQRSDLLGLALNWGDPSDDTLDDQLTSELFYRIQLTQNMAITPSIQFIESPALNPDENFMMIFGLRMRLTF